MIKISIIVCAFNEEFRIQNCLKSIASQIVNNFNIEVLIVDNQSSDNTQKICNKFIKESPDANIRYLRIDHVQLSKSRNVGILNTTGDKVVFIDADAVADKNWLKKLLSGFDNDIVDLVSGKVKNLNNNSDFSKFIYAAYFSSLVLDERTRVLNKGQSNMIGANMAFRRVVFEKTGGFFNNIKGRGDETAVVSRYFELCPDRREKFVSTAVVYNEHAESLKIWLKQQYSEGVGYAAIVSMKNKISFIVYLKDFIRIGNILFVTTLMLSFLISIKYATWFTIFFLIRYGYRYRFLSKSFSNVRRDFGIVKALSVFPLIALGTLILDIGYIVEIFLIKARKWQNV
jgi:glycosyltransferase involved in cell wall biosynthesis